MLALALGVLVFAASPAHLHKGPRQTREQRAARLMTEEELGQLADLDRQAAELRRPTGNGLLFSFSIATMAAGVAVPVVVGVVGLVGTIFVGLFGLLALGFGNSSFLALIPAMWVGLFGWVPIWGWIVMGVTALAGAGMFIAAQVADGPRRQQVHELKQERKRLIDLALTRPEQALLPLPLTTLATF